MKTHISAQRMEIHLLFSELESGVSTHETRESICITQQNANIWREKQLQVLTLESRAPPWG